MINRLLNELELELSKKYKYISQRMLNEELIDLFFLKYYCDNNILTYEETIKAENVRELNIPNDIFEIKHRIIYSNKLLSLIQYEKLKDLITEYLDTADIGINFLNNNEKKICITNSLDKNIYDIKGNTTYITDKSFVSIRAFNEFKLYDKVLNVTNQYQKYDASKIKDYKYLFIYDFMPRYRFIKEENTTFNDFIRSAIIDYNDIKIVIQTDYRKISNMKEHRMLINYLSKIVFYDEKNTFVLFEKKDDDSVSIIDYDRNKIKSLDKLYQIIENNRKQKDILVKTSVKEIKNNYYRIGFNLYQTNFKEEKKNINEIAEENTMLIERLSDLNKDIEIEINKLINR